MIIIELDKSGSEWIIVAHLSGDQNMLDVVSSGVSPHVRTAELISGVPADLITRDDKAVGHNTTPDIIEEIRRDEVPELFDNPDWWLPRSSSIRQAAKKCNHGLNYDMRYRRFALELEIQEIEARELVNRYHGDAYPGIRLWHQTIQTQLRKDRTLTNCFNRKRKFLGPWGPDLFDAAYSFIPQGTTYDLVRMGIKGTYWNESKLFRPLELLTEVHDSLVFQYPDDNAEAIAEVVKTIGLEYMSPTCKYNSREFIIPTTMKLGFDLGNMTEVDLLPDTDKTAKSIKQAIRRLKNGAPTG